jgi:hypothetical protein
MTIVVGENHIGGDPNIRIAAYFYTNVQYAAQLSPILSVNLMYEVKGI